jgi:acetylornithine/N-succinyldiaminopimelate aminotransferase
VRATLAVMEAEDVCGRAQRAGARLARGLQALPRVVSVRGAGLLLAAQLDAPVAKDVAARALHSGLLVNAVRPDAIRVAPPLLVSDEEIEDALGILGRALADTAGESNETSGPNGSNGPGGSNG